MNAIAPIHSNLHAMATTIKTSSEGMRWIANVGSAPTNELVSLNASRAKSARNVATSNPAILGTHNRRFCVLVMFILRQCVETNIAGKHVFVMKESGPTVIFR